MAAAYVASWCSTPALDPSAHAWGTFAACARRLSDECPAAVDGGCRTLAAVERTLTLGARSDGTFLWSREGLPAVEGRQGGARFEAQAALGNVATSCGCFADVTETIRGELLSVRAPVTCVDADGGGCGLDAGRSSVYFEDGVPDETWMSGLDGGVDTTVSYDSFRAIVVDEAVARPGESCACLPCKVVVEIAGAK